MSSVLARMAQRALGARPTAEALKPSRYEPQPSGVRLPPREDAASSFDSERHVEAAPASAPQSSQQAPLDARRPSAARQHPALGSSLQEPFDEPRESKAVAASDYSSPIATEVSETTADASDRAQQRGRRPDETVSLAFPSAQEILVARSRASDAALASEAMLEGERKAALAKDDASDRAQRRGRRHDETVSLAPPSAQAILVAQSRASDDVLASDAKPEDERKAAHAKADVSARAAGVPPRLSPAAAPVETKTEIHISIGAVELRAPRPLAPLQTQPFRPRVSLDEFLGRKPGASG
ncbi:MAG TPA: hypothetical protein VK446_16225 [Methylocystis sp.]|nr:hypothetical protein [Methylocystis sp.]